jgi:soluble lytic murein transglycosylase-like protein
LTPGQRLIYDQIVKLNVEFYNWFDPADVMAFVQVESSFRPNAYRREPSGVASYGLMQVLNTTAKDYGVVNPEDMYFPEISLRTGMKVARAYWDYLRTHLKRDPTRAEWCASYNEGPGNVIKGRPDKVYVDRWMEAQARWSKTIAGL